MLVPASPPAPSRWYLNVRAADLSSSRSLTVNLPPSSPSHSSLPPLFSLRLLLVDAINYATAAYAQLRRCLENDPFDPLFDFGVVPVVQDRENRRRTGLRGEIRAGLERWMSWEFGYEIRWTAEFNAQHIRSLYWSVSFYQVERVLLYAQIVNKKVVQIECGFNCRRYKDLKKRERK